MQMQTRSNVPQSKSREQFAGYEGTTLRYAEENHFRSGGGNRPVEGLRLNTWMEYPPNFKKNVLRRTQFLKRTLDPTAYLGQLPSELKYTLTRNFGFFTTIFTQFFDRDGARNVQKSIGLGK